jgi:hypothetical protein
VANPFATLGVPKYVLARELASGELGRLRVLARANFQGISKVYHPDRGGDEVIMTEALTALQDIQQADDEELEFYVEEMVSERDIRDVSDRQALLDDYARHGAVINRLVHASTAIDQFALLGLNEPRSYLCTLESPGLIVLDVLSPHEVIARPAIPDSSPDPDTHEYDYVYERGLWQQRTLRGRKVVHKTALELLGQNRVTIIGRVSAHRAATPLTSALFMPIESGDELTGIRWDDPRTAWYMEHLSGSMLGGFVLTDANGKHVTLIGDVVAHS